MNETKTVSIRRVRSTLVDEVCEVPASYVARKVIRTPSDTHDVLAFLANRPKEEVWALYLDGRHALIGMEQVSVGTATTSMVHPREVFGPALRLGAIAVVAAHNHPSGDCQPSEEDRSVTERLFHAGTLLGVTLLDHIVICTNGFYSIRSRDRGWAFT